MNRVALSVWVLLLLSICRCTESWTCPSLATLKTIRTGPATMQANPFSVSRASRAWNYPVGVSRQTLFAAVQDTEKDNEGVNDGQGRTADDIRNGSLDSDTSTDDNDSSSSSLSTPEILPGQWTMTEGDTSAIYIDTGEYGIGGKGGVVYDVNKLKKNLVQETIYNYKNELWSLLGSYYEQQQRVQDMLASICQVNPVSTTTDSNLLEGTWTLALRSKMPSSVLFEPVPVKRLSALNRSGGIDGNDGKAERTNHQLFSLASGGRKRTFVLENLREDDYPFVLDSRRFGSRLYDVHSFTTRSILLEPFAKPSDPLLRIEVLYIDVDFMICSQAWHEIDRDGTVPAAVDLSKEPYMLYTKSPQWTARTQQLRRRVKWIWAFLQERFFKRNKKKQQNTDDAASNSDGSKSGTTPNKNNGGSSSSSNGSNKNKQGTTAGTTKSDPILQNRQDVDSSLQVIKFGVDDRQAERIAWEGEEDPFVHLSADERQQTLKDLSVKEIEKLHERQVAKATKLRKRKKRIYERVREFKRPAVPADAGSKYNEKDRGPPEKVFRRPPKPSTR